MGGDSEKVRSEGTGLIHHPWDPDPDPSPLPQAGSNNRTQRTTPPVLQSQGSGLAPAACQGNPLTVAEAAGTGKDKQRPGQPHTQQQGQ